jgi:signal-transduction protein with cAMP-binding, CBS, and nucleotidyltransferase domain
VNGPAVVCDAKTSLKDVAKTLGDLGIGMVVVLEDGAVAGIVSERDLVWAIARDAQLDEVWAADIMTPDAIVVSPATPVAEAAALMTARNARHVLVEGDGDPAVVSMRDVIEYLID